MYYAKSTGGFYSREINGINIPADAVEISDATHEALFVGQSAGKVITSNAAGFPVLSDPVPIPFSISKPQILDMFRATREIYLNRLAGISTDAQAKALPLIVTSCGSFRQGLLDLTSCAGVVAATDEPTLRTAIKSEYDRLVALTDPSLKVAWWKVDFA